MLQKKPVLVLSACLAVINLETNAQGFSPTYTNWSLPVGGLRDGGTHFGYYNISYAAWYNDDQGSETWNLVDMNGDGLNDLVVTSETNATLQKVLAFSPGSNPYWKVYLNNGSGYNASHINWSLPIGGLRDGGTHFGYYNISYAAWYDDDNGSETWNLADMNGDGLVDLVVSSETNATLQKVLGFSPGSNPYWKVYLNNGAGFNTTYTSWGLPIGGMRYGGTHFGYHNISYAAWYNDDNGSETWNLLDINNDGLSDLIVSSETNSALQKVLSFSPGSNPYWKVYLNNGSGFNTTYTSWSMPVGGMRDGGTHFGYFNISYGAWYDDDNGSETWNLIDINDDGLIDLVVSAETNATLQKVLSFSPGSSPYWKVYYNNGTGFNSAYTSWSMPVGGMRYGGTHFGYNNISYAAWYNDDNGSQTWNLVDMNGDGSMDLVVSAETNATLQKVLSFSPGSNPYWKVYMNNGSGFNSAYTSWSMPVGGMRYGGTHFGYNNISYGAWYNDDNGSQTWNLVDMNGDGRTDLVVSSETNSALQKVLSFSPGSNPYWKVYLNNGITGITTSVDDEAALTLNPNPATDYIRISTSLNGKKSQYLVTDADGRTAASGTLTGNETVVNVAALQKGVYVFTMPGISNKALRFVKL